MAKRKRVWISLDMETNLPGCIVDDGDYMRAVPLDQDDYETYQRYRDRYPMGWRAVFEHHIWFKYGQRPAYFDQESW